jgi:hypothetical protein
MFGYIVPDSLERIAGSRCEEREVSGVSSGKTKRKRDERSCMSFFFSFGCMVQLSFHHY